MLHKRDSNLNSSLLIFENTHIPTHKLNLEIMKWLLFFAIRIPDEFIIIIMGDNLTITTVKVIENLLMKPLQMKVILILIIVLGTTEFN